MNKFEKHDFKANKVHACTPMLATHTVMHKKNKLGLKLHVEES